MSDQQKAGEFLRRLTGAAKQPAPTERLIETLNKPAPRRPDERKRPGADDRGQSRSLRDVEPR